MPAFFIVMEMNLYLIIGILLVAALILSFFLMQRKRKETAQKTFKKTDLSTKLAKTKSSFLGKISELIKLRGKVDDDLILELEEILIQADIGVQTSVEIIEILKDQIKTEKIEDTEKVKHKLEEIIRHLLMQDYDGKKAQFQITTNEPFVILFTGVNGVGKTTSIAKLARRFIKQNKKVLLIAADTFRAAAMEQLSEWAKRTGAEIVKQQQGADPSSVVYDGLTKAKNKNFDVVLIDTAGRQHTKINLMNELSKIHRTIRKVIPDAPHENLLVIDATTGQNAISQAEIFNRSTDLSGLILTKLDGTAKGGIVIGIKHQLGIPVKLIGVGESFDDLRDFDINEFVEAIFE